MYVCMYVCMCVYIYICFIHQSIFTAYNSKQVYCIINNLDTDTIYVSAAQYLQYLIQNRYAVFYTVYLSKSLISCI